MFAWHERKGCTSGSFDYSDSVTRLTPRMSRLDFSAPTNRAAENAADLDLGSMTLVWLSNGLVLQAGRAGQAYTMRAPHLGGIGGQLAILLDGNLYALSCRDGGQLGHIHVGTITRFATPAISGNKLYIPTSIGATAVTVGCLLHQPGKGPHPSFDLRRTLGRPACP